MSSSSLSLSSIKQSPTVEEYELPKAPAKIKVFNLKMDKLIVDALLEMKNSKGELGLQGHRLTRFSTKHGVKFEQLKGRIHHLDEKINGTQDASDQLSSQIKLKWKSQRRSVIFSRIKTVAGLIGSIALAVISIGCLVSVVALPVGIILTPIALSGTIYFLYRAAKTAPRPPFVKKTEKQQKNDEAALVAQAINKMASQTI